MSKTRVTSVALVGMVVVVLATATIKHVTGKSSRISKARADSIVFAKEKPEGAKAGRNAQAAIGANEQRSPDSSPDVQAYLQRAYPATDISIDSTLAAQNGWASLNAGAHSAGTWQLIGPSKATQPGVLDVLGDGAQYVTAGRVTAMAIGPNCSNGNCPVYVGAAGGGIWRAKDGLSGSPRWEFTSSSFATNAIGSLVVDPNDPTGLTLYAGTGEPNI
jgi:hypothetical protein